jgi:hypothetical protein
VQWSLRLLQIDSYAMKKTLSFWKSFSAQVRSVGRGLRVFWKAGKFEWFPSEENLLISFWYDWAHYRWLRPNHTIDQFLNRRMAGLEAYVNNPKNKQFKRMLNKVFLRALHRERIREMATEFLLSNPPEHHYAALMEAIWSAYRTDESERENSAIVVMDGDGGQAINGDELTANGNKPMNARAYVIAVQLHFELKGKEGDFESLSRQLPELRSFIRERFGADKLPGRLEEFKGYSYKPGLKERSSAKKGQLRTPFKQIAQHPEIFGKAIADRAQEILSQHFH